MDEGNASPGPKPKVVRLIDQYDLEGVGDELERRWSHPDDRESLRSLADWFNEQLLRAALSEASVDVLSEDVSRLYAILTGDTGSRGERTQIGRRLEREGLDVDAITDTFVSYGAIRSYLVGHRGVSPPSASDGINRESTAQTIEGLRRRTGTVTENKLQRLRKTDELHLGPHRVLVDVQVLCEECGKQYEITGLLESGTCDCFESGETS
ncbi:rod-determining factor RdfA [Natrarchaeobaculum sulfurireducens]|uniref:Uncharacterized protein n=1 Tax=Natrarchaeobaculum sulfurireducens TaxID=2044521 RepID=A0A346PIM0_9EURY|nr:rod-determining factor RdfA [Natrarchaeobaculum sulfurireducens]AXR79365.1 hypothetical protein AArc1_3058 [Natrarchaeobaculum sulfurireducens]AXR83136.1 hypothetical protein AArcMg_3150 [Natrarchaeobaculum sulfurireducens]